MHGNLREIAGPGLLIEAPLEVKIGERVLVVVQAADDKVVQDIGEVRHIRPAEKGYAIAVELTGVTEANVDELVRLTNVAATNFTNERTGKSRVKNGRKNKRNKFQP